MNHRLKTIKARKDKKDKSALEQWAWIRGGGQMRFIFRFTLVYSLATMIPHELTSGGIGLSTIISTHFTGLIMGLFLWWHMENRYKKACGQGRVNAATQRNP